MLLRPGAAPPWLRVLLAVLGGLLVAGSLPPWGFWPLSFAGIALFDVVVSTDPSRRRRAAMGFGFGGGWLVTGMAWMWFLTVPGYVLAGSLFASFHALAALIPADTPWQTVARPAAHTAVESIRFVAPFGGVPLASLAIGQAGGPLLVLARVGGVILLTWVVFQAGFALGALVRSTMATGPQPASRPIAFGAIAACALTVPIAMLAPSGHDLDVEPVTVAAVQGGGEQGTSALDVPSDLVTQAHLDATATIAPDDELDLVVWPENSIDVDGRPFAESWEYEAVAAEAARLGVPFAVGITEDSEFSTHPTPDSFVNAQVVVTPSAEITSRYEKVRIVPFGEFVPLRGPLEALGAPLDQIPSDATPGSDPAHITLPDETDVGVMISWEVFFGSRGADAARDGTTFLINPTNGASYTGTILQTQQIASSRLRAAETGRWVVQVSPTGFSAFVSPDGDVLDRTDVSEQRVITRDVPQRAGTTWYQRLGDWPWRIAVLLVLAAVLRIGTRRFDETGESDETHPVTPPASA